MTSCARYNKQLHCCRNLKFLYDLKHSPLRGWHVASIICHDPDTFASECFVHADEHQSLRRSLITVFTTVAVAVTLVKQQACCRHTENLDKRYTLESRGKL